MAIKNISLFQSLKRSKDVLYIFILALVVAIVWIVLGVYHTTVETTVPAAIQKLTVPLNPVIDEKMLQRVSTRTTFTQEELANFPINREIIEEVGASPTPRPTPTPTPTATPTSTTSGSLL